MGFVLTSLVFMRKYGLLPSDALVVTIMEKSNIENLVSYDPDFDRVEWVRRYAP